MELKIHLTGKTKIAELVSEKIEIRNTQDVLDLMANADYLGARKIIVHSKQIIPDFFDLKTRIAGEILQKFMNYDVQLAIIGDFSVYASKSLKGFIYESNQIGAILFLPTVEMAKGKMN